MPEKEWMKLVNYVANRVYQKIHWHDFDEIKSSALLAVVQAERLWDSSKSETLTKGSFIISKSIQLVIDDMRATHDLQRGNVKVQNYKRGNMESYVTPQVTPGVLELFDSLTNQERNLLMMRYQGGLTQKEIGKTFGIPQSSLSCLLAKAKEKLRSDCN